MRVLLTGGGTGGHLFPGMAIAEALAQRHRCTLLFVGTRRGIEARIVPSRHIPFRTVWISGLHRGRLWGNMLFPIKMAVSLIQSLSILLQFKPDVVVGTGGYVTWPVIRAAVILGIPTVLQEQNEAPGLVIRKLAHRVSRVHLSFDTSSRHFRRQDNLRVSGNPTRRDLDAGDRQEAQSYFGLNPARRTLFVFGGSQGALGLNRAFIQALPLLVAQDDLQILWGTGPRWIDEVGQAVAPWADRIVARPFIDRMDLAYGAADLLLCRSGATTMAEVTRLGLPAVYVPFPGAAAGHQEQNARVVEAAGGGRVLLESEANPEALAGMILGLIQDPSELKNMAERAKSLGKPQAADVIAEDIVRLVHRD